MEKSSNIIYPLHWTISPDLLLDKYIDVSKYKILSDTIPDKYLHISEIYPPNEIHEIWNNLKDVLEEHSIKPFADIYGNTILCYGFSKENNGNIFYFDYDFGCIKIGNSIEEFSSKLINKMPL